MKGYPNPACRQCRGSGDIERMYETFFGLVINYEPCPCTFKTVWVDEEDWTSKRTERTAQ